MSGNQSAAVYLEYILSQMKEKGTLPDNAVMYNTIVTSDLGELVARSYGVDVEKTLTGFKFIGDKIRKYEQTHEKHLYLVMKNLMDVLLKISLEIKMQCKLF